MDCSKSNKKFILFLAVASSMIVSSGARAYDSVFCLGLARADLHMSQEGALDCCASQPSVDLLVCASSIVRNADINPYTALDTCGTTTSRSDSEACLSIMRNTIHLSQSEALKQCASHPAYEYVMCLSSAVNGADLDPALAIKFCKAENAPSNADRYVQPESYRDSSISDRRIVEKRSPFVCPEGAICDQPIYAHGDRSVSAK